MTRRNLRLAMKKWSAVVLSSLVALPLMASTNPAWGVSGTYLCDASAMHGSWVKINTENYATFSFDWSLVAFDACVTGNTRVEERWVYHGTYSYDSSGGCAPKCFDKPAGATLTCISGIDRPVGCGGQRSDCGYVLIRDTYEGRCQCNLTINSFSGDKSAFNPGNCQTVGLAGAISETFNNTVEWTVAIAGRSFKGSGTIVTATWDGTGADGKIVSPGTYTATLTASVPNGGCADTKSFQVTVQCNLSITNLKSDKAEIDPTSGGIAAILANYTGPTCGNNTDTWKVTINGPDGIVSETSGSGPPPNPWSIAWNGTDSAGRIVAPGIYTVTFSARTSNGGCSDSKSLGIKVVEGPKKCGFTGPVN